MTRIGYKKGFIFVGEQVWVLGLVVIVRVKFKYNSFLSTTNYADNRIG
jgi:hypothetical protein